MLNKIHYISQGATFEEQEKDILEALEAGCKLIQLRFKNGTKEKITELAKRAKVLCQFHEAKLIINDWVEIAKEIDADGVHLGLMDTSVREARELLGPTKIIGGTANTLEDVLQRIEEHCDYIGLGPFRFTATKEKLSPVLGLEGYYTILQEMADRCVFIPVYAIGGIELADLEKLKHTGIYGVAVSGVISKSGEKAHIVKEIAKALK
ncbi:thiamine phosphate synthase [Fluviicola sp.]|jgi:thiamine-phosphate pyrophosphorylase|uniref:thiamine phosphate synthase n=1 Tax=Fluviicola sp. TaxID=1917219 RepID=UPI002826E3A2|nr:thiamine phosphate synthase [Fluviicola sp.]MDR0802765.1 thiamine phosphate synthase [Fluviicola sp.]